MASPRGYRIPWYGWLAIGVVVFAYEELRPAKGRLAGANSLVLGSVALVALGVGICKFFGERKNKPRFPRGD